jgi:hypothetical protein
MAFPRRICFVFSAAENEAGAAALQRGHARRRPWLFVFRAERL